jgi:cellulose synthase/poly-beta-1,6-N-acetylglucosamine synthase-like glycosyltransferase
VTPSEIAFWFCVGCVLYPHALYPALLALWARRWPRPLRPRQAPPRSVSIVVAAHNEEKAIDHRLAELTGHLEASGLDGEVIVVSDGSTDDTAALARAHTTKWVRVIELPHRLGKAAALTRGCAEARGEVLAFTDVRQSWAADALPLLLENFADPDVGAVSGDLVVAEQTGALAGVGMYWRFEKWLRCQESRVGSQVGVTGAISAVRRELFQPIPPGILLDDVYWPLAVALQGKRVVHDSRAVAHDRLPERTCDEFRRKVRTLAGNFQLAARLPAALLPWRNPVWVPLVSHKLLRLAVPWALLALLALSLTLPGWPYRVALGLQLAGYAGGLFALASGRGGRLGAAAGSFLVLNAAAWVAFWVWLTGRADRCWQKALYERPQGSWRAARPTCPAEQGPPRTCSR